MKTGTTKGAKAGAGVPSPSETPPPVAAGTAELIDLNEAMAMLKTSRPTFHRWLRSGKLKGMKVGRRWRFYRADIERFLKGKEPHVEVTGDFAPLLGALRQRLADCGHPAAAAASDVGPDAQAASLMIATGFFLRASDIHLEPVRQPESGATVGVVRCRIDGVLHVVAEFDARLLRPLVDRWKIMGSANLHESRVPQDCRVLVTVAGKELDLRVCFLPACLGEAVTIRILDAAAVRLTLDHIAYAPHDRAALDRLLKSPWGTLVVTGPTGSGKTTALYSCINQCASAKAKVVSIEDPVEFVLPWLTQVAVRPAVGMTFAVAVRAVLRSDPDVIMVGELRDMETLMVAQQAALTGHLVMTTLHAEDAPAALCRMVDMGSDPFIVADATKLVVAQRLVRQLCRHCSREELPSAEALERAAGLARDGGLAWEALPKRFRVPSGCAQCRQTGYRGRNVVAEALEVTPEIGVALRRRVPLDELRRLAVRQGMTSMAADGIRRAAEGLTSLAEVLRVIGLR